MKDFIKCRDVIVNKNKIMFVGINNIRDLWELYINIGNDIPSIYETFETEAEARKEFDNIYKQLQEEDVEESQPQKYKITIREFWKSDKSLAIHCDTKEKANMLLVTFDKLGKTWGADDSYLKCNCWNNYKEETCYSNNRGYASIDWYRASGYKVYEFEDVDLDN